MATPAPKPKGVGAGIKSLPKPAIIAIPLVGALAFYLYQKRKASAASTAASTAATTPAAVDTTGAAAVDTTGAAAADTTGSSGGGTDFQSQIDALQGADATEVTDLNDIKSQNTQLLATETKDLSVDNSGLATAKADLATDKADLASDNSGLITPVRAGGSTTAKKKVVTPKPKLAKPLPSPKVTGAKTAPAKKIGYTAPRPTATVSGGRANSSRGPIPLKPPAKKK